MNIENTNESPVPQDGAAAAATAFDRVRALALTLSFEERVRLVESLVAGIEAQSFDKVWCVQNANRLAAFRSGGIEAIDFSDYLRKYDVK